MGIRESILGFLSDASKSHPRERVDLPEVGITVFVKTLTATELFELRAWCREGLDKGEDIPDSVLSVKAVITATVDESGAPIFLKEDCAAWESSPPKFLYRLWLPAGRLNGLVQDEADSKNSPMEETSTGSSRLPDSSVATQASFCASTTPKPGA